MGEGTFDEERAQRQREWSPLVKEKVAGLTELGRKEFWASGRRTSVGGFSTTA